MRAPLLSVSALHKRFGARVLFDGAQMALEAGHGYVLSGANGSGKTTLLRMIAGLETAQQGRLQFRDETVAAEKIPEAWRRDIVYVHQQPYLFHTTIEKNLEYGLARRGVARMEMRARVREALGWAGLMDRRDVPPQKLSVARRNAPRSRAPGCSIPRCCCSTSRRRISMVTRASRCSNW